MPELPFFVVSSKPSMRMALEPRRRALDDVDDRRADGGERYLRARMQAALKGMRAESCMRGSRPADRSVISRGDPHRREPVLLRLPLLRGGWGGVRAWALRTWLAMA
eukprot:5501383-Prymnesium_polylepis.2